MAGLLYICASPLEDLSYSKAVADAFVQAYKQQNSEDEVETLKLFDKELPQFDLRMASAKYKILHQLEHTEEDKKYWATVEKLIEHFKSFDKYIFAVPMWNFSIPYRLKQYIDILVQPGYAFTMDQQGNYIGLIKDKKVVVAYASGGAYTSQEMLGFDMQKSYMDLIFGFVGITDVQKIVCAPTLAQGPDAARQAKQQAISEAQQLAKNF